MTQIVKLDEEIVIDMSAVPAPPVTTPTSRWNPPKHVYFGKKMEDGSMEPEPVYVHQEYPKMMYQLVFGKLRAVLVRSGDEEKALDPDQYKANPAQHGVITAPSHEQVAEERLVREVDKRRYKGEAEFQGVLPPKAKAK